MPAPITTVVDVSVVVAGASAEKFSFGNLMGVFEHSVTVNRQDGPFADLAALNAAGFTSTAAPAINAWGTAVFAQDDGVDQLLIGRRIPLAGATAGQVWQVTAVGPAFSEQTAAFNNATDADWIVFPAAEAVGDYAAIGYPGTFITMTLDNANGTAGTVGTVDWEYWNGSAWAALTGVTDGTTEFTAAAADGQVVSWTLPLDWAAMSINSGPSLFYVRAIVTAEYTIDPVYDQGFLAGAGDATWTATMDAIELFDSGSWYITNIESRVDADIAAVAAWTEARTKIYIAQSADITGLTAFTSLNTFGYLRTAGIFHLTSTGTDGYLDGAWSSSGGGLNLDAPKGRGTWFARELEGVTFDKITGAQATALLAVAGNFFGRNKGLSFTQSGTVAKSATDFIDITTTKDWVKERIDERVVEGFVGTPTVVPYDNAGINVVAGWVQEILDRGVTNGHFTNDSINGPGTVIVPDVSTISETVKKTRVLTLTATATFAGGIQKLTLTVNITF